MVINGYVTPALENAQIFLSCRLGIPHKEVISTCTNEAVWSPDVSLLDLECQHKLTNNHSTTGDCEQLFSAIGIYRILNHTNNISYSEGSLMDFQCIHTPYQIDPLFTTQCQAGQWDPHPRDVCDQGVTINVGYGWSMPSNSHLQILVYVTNYYVGWEIQVIASLGVVIVFLCVIIIGTLLTIIHKHHKKGTSSVYSYSYVY